MRNIYIYYVRTEVNDRCHGEGRMFFTNVEDATKHLRSCAARRILQLRRERKARISYLVKFLVHPVGGDYNHTTQQINFKAVFKNSRGEQVIEFYEMSVRATYLHSDYNTNENKYLTWNE